MTILFHKKTQCCRVKRKAKLFIQSYSWTLDHRQLSGPAAVQNVVLVRCIRFRQAGIAPYADIQPSTHKNRIRSSRKAAKGPPPAILGPPLLVFRRLQLSLIRHNPSIVTSVGQLSGLKDAWSGSKYHWNCLYFADVVLRKHVLSDLRPYVCTVRDCEIPDQCFASRLGYINHEICCNGLSKYNRSTIGGTATGNIQGSNICLFCGEEIATTKEDRGRHIGRHMEEIAFTVVSKPYEEWDFYSDSSANGQMQSTEAN